LRVRLVLSVVERIDIFWRSCCAIYASKMATTGEQKPLSLAQITSMKPNILLVAHGDGTSNSAIADAAAQTGHGLRHASSGREAFAILKVSLADVDLVIIDVDPGIHSLSILEALSFSRTAPPVIVVTGFEESEMEPIAYCHGATACIGKPFTSGELAALIAEVRPFTSEQPPTSCDLWGHPRATHTRKRVLQRRAA
jgi:DNA-binding response OmpR family regulator